MSRRYLFWLIVLCITALAIPAFLADKNFLENFNKIPKVNISLIAAAIITQWALQFLVGAILFYPYCLRLPSISLAFSFFLSILFIVRITPIGIGAPIIIYTLARNYGISGYRVMSIFLMTALLDILAILNLCLLATFIQVSDRLSSTHALISILILAGILGAMFIGTKYYRRLVGVLAFFFSKIGIPHHRKILIIRFLLRWGKSTNELLTMPPLRLSILFFLTLFQWALLLSILWLSVISVGGALSWQDGFSIQLLANIAGHFTGIPGGMVSSEAIAALYLLPTIGAEKTGSAILFWRVSVQYLPALLGGIAFFLIRGHLLPPKE